MKKGHIVIHCVVVLLALGAAGAAWAMDLIDFFAPRWLLGLLLLPALTVIAHRGISGLPSVTNAVSATTRSLLFLIVIICLARPQVVKESDDLCVMSEYSLASRIIT